MVVGACLCVRVANAFCNRRRDMVKLFFYERGGFWICAKRLEAGTFRGPARHELNPLTLVSHRRWPTTSRLNGYDRRAGI